MEACKKKYDLATSKAKATSVRPLGVWAESGMLYYSMDYPHLIVGKKKADELSNTDGISVPASGRPPS